MTEKKELCDVCEKPESTYPIMVICEDCIAKKDTVSFCNFCRMDTLTKDWDCLKCNLSKIHPLGEKQ